jgi:hypothetical protein
VTPPHGEPQQPYGDQPYGDDQEGRQYGRQQPYDPYPPSGSGQPAYGQPAYGQPTYGAPGYGVAPGPPPENHLVWAILSTVLCCLPLGIVAIIKSTQVNSLWAQGQYDAARQSAVDARKWAMWSAIAAGSLFAILILIYVVLIIFALNVQPS